MSNTVHFSNICVGGVGRRGEGGAGRSRDVREREGVGGEGRGENAKYVFNAHNIRRRCDM